MKKIGILLFTLFILLSFSNVKASEFNIDSKNAILYNLNDNKIIYQKNKDEVISIASLTKIMTCLVTIEQVDDLNKELIISSKVFDGTGGLSKAGFQVGQKVTYYDLLYGAMLPSGADATNALALNVSGSIDGYVSLMNKKAKELKLNNTHFKNTTGLDHKEHYSSVSDVAKLLKYAIKNKKFKKIFTTLDYKTTDGKLNFMSSLKRYSLKYNLDYYKIKGAKTGFTDEAGLCMASITDSSDVNYLLVTCRGNSKDKKPHQVLDAITIYDYYTNNYKYQTILSKNEKLIELKVKNSDLKKISFKSNKQIKVFLKKDIKKSDLIYKYKGKKILSPDDKKGTKLGEYYIYYKNEILYKKDIYLTKKIESNLFDRIIIYSGIILAALIISLMITKSLFKKK